ncbi:MAG: quinol:cytochrome C oxidoreductase [bacterium]|nr:quinol:cytochrome C oxidoreductase [bacterium]
MDKARLHPFVLGMTILGALGVAASWFAGGLPRFGANWIIWSLLLLSVALGSLFLVALEHLTRAQWSIVLRRVPERLAGLLPALAILFAIGAALGLGGAFGWATPEFRQAMVTEHHQHSKAIWYATPFFLARLAAIFAIWLVSWRLLAGGSVKQDESRDPRFSLFAKRYSAPFMWLFALSVTILGVDWLMGMSPRWFSTMFGIYTFAGVFLSGLAATTLGILHLQRRGRLTEVRGDHLYSLGGFLFAFTVFWAYIAFSQFMLIWYANLPEETFWFHARLTQGWYPVTILLAVVRFVIPFFALLSREVKMDARRLAWVAWLILAGQALDLYWLIFPELGLGFVLGWQELAFALCFTGLGLILAQRRMAVGKDLPVGDPNLDTSLHYHL